MIFSSQYFTDTIVALSTPRGVSGMGVIRMSGPDAVSILRKIFRAAKGDDLFQDRRAVYGTVVDPRDGSVLDDGIALVMRGPSSYTGQDVAELSLHGSPLVLDWVVRLMVKQGARPATRGEFTRRAFLAGRIDLIQAEAVIDLIESTSPAAVKEARARLDRSVSAKIHEIAGALKDLVADMEAHLDFDEDDQEPAPQPRAALQDVLVRMEELIRGAKVARLIRDGISTVIVGKPNVGKSTLFNALVRADRMIVTPYPGTTRDPVEERIVLGETAFNLWDTAGIRDNPESIELEGIRRTKERIETAELVLAVFDGSASLEAQDLAVMESCRDKPTVVLLNKMDLGACVDTQEPVFGPSGVPRFAVSAATGEGLESLKAYLAHFGTGAEATGALGHKTGLNQRCAYLMEAAAAAVRDLVENLERGTLPGPDIVSLELIRALASIEEITGERAGEGILERIFERFCVGK